MFWASLALCCGGMKEGRKGTVCTMNKDRDGWNETRCMPNEIMHLNRLSRDGCRLVCFAALRTVLRKPTLYHRFIIFEYLHEDVYLRPFFAVLILFLRCDDMVQQYRERAHSVSIMYTLTVI